jgi:hypothetical protein
MQRVDRLRLPVHDDPSFGQATLVLVTKKRKPRELGEDVRHATLEPGERVPTPAPPKTRPSTRQWHCSG